MVAKYPFKGPSGSSRKDASTGTPGAGRRLGRGYAASPVRRSSTQLCRGTRGAARAQLRGGSAPWSWPTSAATSTPRSRPLHSTSAAHRRPRRRAFGDLSIAQFERPQKIRPMIVRWRAIGPIGRGPRIRRLRRSLACSRTPSIMEDSGNPCHGIKPLYSVTVGPRMDGERRRGTQTQCSPEIAHVVDLAAHTGLRLRDLIRLSWSHVGDDEM